MRPFACFYPAFGAPSTYTNDRALFFAVTPTMENYSSHWPINNGAQFLPVTPKMGTNEGAQFLPVTPTIGTKEGSKFLPMRPTMGHSSSQWHQQWGQITPMMVHNFSHWHQRWGIVFSHCYWYLFYYQWPQSVWPPPPKSLKASLTINWLFV